MQTDLSFTDDIAMDNKNAEEGFVAGWLFAKQIASVLDAMGKTLDDVSLNMQESHWNGRRKAVVTLKKS